MSKTYKFTIENGLVTAIYEIKNGRIKLEHIDSDEVWSFDGVNVTKAEYDDGRLETTTYSDTNGDGLFLKTGKTYASSLSDIARNDDDRRSNDFRDHDYHNDDYGRSSHPMLNPNFTRYSEKGYQFDIDADGVVTAVYEVKHGRVKAERMDWNETWISDGVDVIQTDTKFGKVETTVYTDVNQDGVFQKGFELEVLTGQNLRTLETYKFILTDGSNATGEFAAEGDTITGMMELGRRGWKVDRIDANETLQVVEVDGDTLILKTKARWNGDIDFSVFRDDDNDGLWTEIADGQTLDTYLSIDGEVDLVGIVDAGLFEASYTLVA